jgi:ketosteroid isomerase-like protein
MNESRQPVNWNRLAIEGAVIVFSILLAFAIDAWWGERQERVASANAAMANHPTSRFPFDDDAQVIENSYNDWVKVLNSRDIELWSSFLAPNAVFLPPGNPLLKTNKDIIDYYSALFGNPQFIGLKCSQDFAEVAGSRDIAWTRGTCNAFFRAESGAEESRTSKWTKVWVRLEDGTWKCRLNAWNFNESD